MVIRLFRTLGSFIRSYLFINFFLLIAGIFIVVINPLAGLFTPCCLIKKITGYYCAGCGMTTGFYSLIKGDFAGASERNLLIITLIPAALLYLFQRKIIFHYYGKYKYRYDEFIIILFIISVIIFTVCRNISIPEFDILRPH